MMDYNKRGKYFSSRTGKVLWDRAAVFWSVKKEFSLLYKKLDEDRYFQEYFGTDCENCNVPGKLGDDFDISEKISIFLGKENLWPIWNKISDYTEDDFFDIIEFLYDYCSKPVSLDYSHGLCDHYKEFDKKEGQSLFRVEVNKILSQLDYEMSQEGRIIALPNEGFKPLLEALVPALKDEGLNAEKIIDGAIKKFRSRGHDLAGKEDALRDLAGILEYLKPQVKEHLLTQDEKDLFNIANNFGIRHHNSKQKNDYDHPTWWIFYCYLSTIHLLLRLIKRDEPKGT